MGSVLFCSVDMRCLETVGRHIIEKSLFYIYLYLRLSVCVRHTCERFRYVCARVCQEKTERGLWEMAKKPGNP